MQSALDSMEVMDAMAEKGLEASLSDAGVGAMCALTAVRGAYLNVRINCKGFVDTDFVTSALQKAEKIHSTAVKREAEIIEKVMAKI
jgi:glutamate formiminotransferase/formiminotetrahydrofolate cyclodeaminase